ncbi:hypothetical protein A3860_22695 [Niastella vici]|uniref:Ribosomal subunit interface protein n=1 Tax=Niastella vici TaxID=1703345 RepID=A0A1V9FZJ2_9BACT|nr:HPF/RaiA family ribosome-associated protein [Niastella vici]OQP63752.1 hypothetical protein A3860_22695 [Niastella vici]
MDNKLYYRQIDGADRIDKEIAAARVHFKTRSSAPDEDKICEIELTIYGDSLFINSKATSFEKAVRDAMQELSQRIDEQLKNMKVPLSTVEPIL